LTDELLCALPTRALRSSERWLALERLAASQAGYFTLGQARRLGGYLSLLRHHCARGRLIRARRGLYRFAAAPAHPFEELVCAWLWSEGRGIFSHGTALHLHGLLDAPPRFVQISVPPGWRPGALRRPGRTALHVAEVPLEEREVRHGLPVIAVPRALREAGSSLRDRRWIELALRRALQRDAIDLRFAHEVLERWRA
jgi:hypothetical protein